MTSLVNSVTNSAHICTTPQNEAYDLKKQIEDLTKELDELKIKYAPCPNKIAFLQTELAAVKAALAPCQGEIKELKAHVARLDSKLSVELEKGEGASNTCLTVSV